MKCDYQDILSLTAKPPEWFDENGTPRWNTFTPGCQANVYAVEVALMTIGCQECGTTFKACSSASRRDPGKNTLADELKLGVSPYGDPPNTGHCDGGHTVTAEIKNVLEFWTRKSQGWERNTLD